MAINRKVAALAAVAGLAGVGTYGAGTFVSLRPSTFLWPLAEVAAVNAVKYALVDPDSAQFRGVSACPFGHGYYQGQVNARNKMGGYTGFDDFVADSDPGHVIILSGDGNYEEQLYAKGICAGGRDKAAHDIGAYEVQWQKAREQEDLEMAKQARQDEKTAAEQLGAAGE